MFLFNPLNILNIGHDSNVAELRAAIAARHAAFATYSVELLINTRFVFESQAKPVELLDQMTYTADSRGRVLMNITSQSAFWNPTPGNIPPTRTWTAGFDGTLAKSKYTNTSKSGGLTYSTRLSKTPDCVSFRPADLVASILGAPITYAMDQVDPKSSTMTVRSFVQDNQSISELTTITNAINGVNGDTEIIQTILTFLRDRGCALAKHEIVVKRPRDKIGHTTFLAEFKDWISVNGHLVAQTAQERHWDLLPESARVLRRSLTIECKNWKVNPVLPDNWFVVNVPKGSWVNDDIRGISYLEGMTEMTDDKSLAKAIIAAKDMFESNSDVSIPRPLVRPAKYNFKLLAATVVAVGATIAVLMTLWRRRHA